MFKTKEQKKLEKEQKKLEQQKQLEFWAENEGKKMGLNNIDVKDARLLSGINPKHFGSGLQSFVLALQLKTYESYSIDMQKSLIAQNWFMIRQNDKMISLLKNMQENTKDECNKS
jgi:hypothetical protein